MIALDTVAAHDVQRCADIREWVAQGECCVVRRGADIVDSLSY
ncbi:MAG: hypothetical protein RR510_02795 [Morganella sp. (in: enterobacteria)]